MCVAGRPAASVQPQSAPTASDFKFRPRLRLPTAAQQPVTSPTSLTPRGPAVATRPQTTPTGTRPTRPPTGIARPTVIQNPSSASHPPVARSPVGIPLARHLSSGGRSMGAPTAMSEAPELHVRSSLPVPRRSMAPSRIAAIMLRRQYSSDQVSVSYTSSTG